MKSDFIKMYATTIVAVFISVLATVFYSNQFDKNTMVKALESKDIELIIDQRLSGYEVQVKELASLEQRVSQLEERLAFYKEKADFLQMKIDRLEK